MTKLCFETNLLDLIGVLAEFEFARLVTDRQGLGEAKKQVEEEEGAAMADHGHSIVGCV